VTPVAALGTQPGRSGNSASRQVGSSRGVQGWRRKSGSGACRKDTWLAGKRVRRRSQVGGEGIGVDLVSG